jgi:hypothetical protein
MADPPAREFFDRAREWVSGALFLAGALAIVSSMLDWVTYKLGPGPTPGITFRVSEPRSGLDVGDGRWVLGAGIVIIVAAFLLVLRQKAGYAGLAMLASIVIGAIGVSDYRGIGEVTKEVDLVGVPHVGIGLTLAVAAAVLGLLASIAGIAATPRRDD